MSDQITYDNKVDLQVATNIANINKVTASDMNEIKSVVNGNATTTETELTRLETDKLDIADVLNQASTDTDKPYSANYLNDKLVSVGAEAPTGGERVWFKKGKNLYNNALISANLIKARTTITYENEQIVMSTTGADAYFGNIVSVGNSWSEQYGQLISVEPNTNYTLSITNNVVDKNLITYYDENKVSIRNDYNQPYQVTFTTPNNAKYVSFRFGITNSTSDGVYKFNIQLEKGSTATTYEPYVEPSINVDEEEWYNPNNIEKYSTKEIKIGTWIDGKPLYRKVVDIGTLPNATTKHVAHNISNIGSVVTLRGIVTDYRFFPVPFVATSNAFAISIFADKTNIEVMTGNDRSNMTGFVIIEYTKTTD